MELDDLMRNDYKLDLAYYILMFDITSNSRIPYMADKVIKAIQWFICEQHILKRSLLPSTIEGNL